jgi:outer membrane receptor for monomeric catechols
MTNDNSVPVDHNSENKSNSTDRIEENTETTTIYVLTTNMFDERWYVYISTRYASFVSVTAVTSCSRSTSTFCTIDYQ